MTVRRLVPADAEAFHVIRGQALLAEPFAFGASPEHDVAASLGFVTEMLARTGQATFGAFDPDLVGVVGIGQPAHRKSAPKTLAALALYRSLRFEVWGDEPAALRVGDVLVGEKHLILALDRREPL